MLRIFAAPQFQRYTSRYPYSLPVKSTLMNNQLGIHLASIASKYILLPLIMIFLASHSASSYANTEQQHCITINTEEDLNKQLVINTNKERLTLVYARADWAVSTQWSNDIYVPSLAFFRITKNINCIIADISDFRGNSIIEKFAQKGIPFFVLLDNSGNTISALADSKDYYEFSQWISSVEKK